MDLTNEEGGKNDEDNGKDGRGLKLREERKVCGESSMSHLI